MKTNVWYVSKYHEPLNKFSTGSRGFHLSKELNELDFNVTVFTADSPHLQERKELTDSYLKEDINGLEIIWIKTLKFKKVRSIKRIISWLQFEFSFIRYFLKSDTKPEIRKVALLC